MPKNEKTTTLYRAEENRRTKMTHTSEAITEHIFEFINGRRTKCNSYFGYMHEARQDRAQRKAKNFIQRKAKNFIILFLNRVASKARGDRDIKNTVCYWICFWKYTVIEIATWPSVADIDQPA